MQSALHNFLIWVEDPCRIDKTCAENGVIPIKNNSCLIGFWFFWRSQPNSFVGELTQESSPNLIRSFLKGHILTYFRLWLLQWNRNYFILLQQILWLGTDVPFQNNFREIFIFSLYHVNNFSFVFFLLKNWRKAVKVHWFW